MALKNIALTRKLRSDAAASWKRMDKAGMPEGGINSAWRDPAEQRELFLDRYKPQLFGSGPYGDVRWWKGKRYVRHSPAGMVAVPGSSLHEDGLAVDMATGSAAHKWMLKNAGRHGWRRTIASEPWHWEHDKSRDLVLKAQIAAAKAKAKRRATARAKVKKIQVALKKVGLYPGAIDGIPGGLTESGFNRLGNYTATLGTIQGYLGVTRDRIKGPITKKAWAKLKAAAK